MPFSLSGHHCQPNIHRSPSWSSVCQMIILLQRVLSRSFVSFFSFLSPCVCPLWCGHSCWWCGGKDTICIMARPEILDLVNDNKLFQGKAFPSTSTISPVLHGLFFNRWTLAQSCGGTTCVFSSVCTHFSCGLLHSMVCCAICHTLLQGKRKFPFAVQQVNEAWLAKGGQSLEHLFSCSPFHQD